MPEKIIIDTNFLITPFKFKCDIFSELKKLMDQPYTLNILDKTIDELKGKEHEKLALNLIKAKNINIIKTEKNKNVDNLLLDLAGKEKFIVCTSDRELRKKLESKGIKTINLRQKKYLRFD
ncbi:MAG: hypothetical protein PHT54_04140 [Candidatus Nanoarchaeia archaeon]|nr:hypothetical protein [Candidatus Nanoarchaeia archaeon]